MSNDTAKRTQIDWSFAAAGSASAALRSAAAELRRSAAERAHAAGQAAEWRGPDRTIFDEYLRRALHDAEDLAHSYEAAASRIDYANHQLRHRLETDPEA